MTASADDLHSLLIESVADYAIFMLDRDGRVVSWNGGAARIKGYRAEEIIGQHFSRFYTEPDREAGVPAAALLTAQQDGRFTAEGWRLRKDGSRFWAMVAIAPIRRNDTLIGFAKITRDITKQHLADLAARESDQRFRLLVQGVTDYAIFMLDPDGRVTNWNVGAQRIKGYTEPEIVGQHFSVFYTQEDRADDAPARALEAAHHAGRYEAEGWRVRKDGSRFWASVVLDAIHDDTGVLIGFAKITRDLTERREAQLQLDRSRQQFFEAQKMEAVGQLTGGMAHDFNNLLTGILGSLELGRARLARGRMPEADRHLAAAQEAGTRAAALTHRLLAFARRQTLDPRPTDANALVAGILDLVQRSVGAAIQLETVADAGLWPALCDPNQLENALLNLCINARDAMPEGGRLTIETANIRHDGASAAGGDLATGDYVVLSVSDTGAGMSAEVSGRAFEPFYTTKPTGKGTGLGLSMVYGFARQTGGTARIESVPGHGTTVRIFLPRCHHTAAAAGPAAPESVEPDGRTVLVVDDEPMVRMLVTDVLTDLGHRSLQAADAEAGLSVLQSDAKIDLLITDVRLPGALNGVQMVEASRAVRPDLKVLFITGYAFNAATGGGYLKPGVQVLTKPFGMDRLASSIKRILAR